MRVAGDDRPSDGRFNYRYSDRQDGETEKERGVKAVVVSGRTAELSFRAVLFILGELDLKWPSPAASQGVNGGLTWTGKEVRYLLYIWADKSFFSTFFLCLPQTDLITECMHLLFSVWKESKSNGNHNRNTNSSSDSDYSKPVTGLIMSLWSYCDV